MTDLLLGTFLVMRHCETPTTILRIVECFVALFVELQKCVLILNLSQILLDE